MNEVVLLDPGTDQPIGTMEKLRAHREGRYHSALSVLLVNTAGLHILQRRAASKYHSADLWANACCSHPLPGELAEDAAYRRLKEEMGVSCPLTRLGTVRYRAQVPAGPGAGGDLVEYEHVALFGGIHDGALAPAAAEVSETRLVSGADLGALPLAFWFRLYTNILGPDLQRSIAGAISGGAAPKDYGFFTDIP